MGFLVSSGRSIYLLNKSPLSFQNLRWALTLIEMECKKKTERKTCACMGLPVSSGRSIYLLKKYPQNSQNQHLALTLLGTVCKKKTGYFAVHSDAWILAVAFYFGARFGFENNERNRLFSLMRLPTIFEVVTGVMKKQQVKAKSSVSNHSSNKSKPSSKTRLASPPAKSYSKQASPKEDIEEEDDDVEDEHGDTLCGACGDNYASDEFWICYDLCEIWFHRKCVKITPARAEHIKQYKCPACTNKRSR